MLSKTRPAVRCALLALALAAAGCGGPSSESTSPVRLSPGPGWTRAEVKDVLVPGRCLAAWTGPEGATIALVRALPIPNGTAKGLADELANRLDHLPGVKVESVGVGKLDGVETASVTITAPGTGGAITPSGLGTPTAPAGVKLIPTLRRNIGFPLRDGTYWIIIHYPASLDGGVSNGSSSGHELSAVMDTVKVRRASSASY